MEIYNSLDTQASKEFHKLLDEQLSKTKGVTEGKIVDGEITKVTDKFIFLHLEGLKSEPVLDVNELKTLGMIDKIKVGNKISVLLERIEDKNGEVLVSASKAQKIKGWESLMACHDKNEPVNGKITGRVKGGAIVQRVLISPSSIF